MMNHCCLTATIHLNAPDRAAAATRAGTSPGDVLRCLSRLLISMGLILSITGCAMRRPSTVPPPLADLQSLLARYQPITSARGAAIAQSVPARLTTSLPNSPTPTLLFLRASTPFAFAFPPRMIVISTEFIRSIEHEAEFAFVVAHEIAHLVLNHYDQRTSSLTPHERQTLEHEADAGALLMVIRAGYDPYVAIQAIERVRFHGEDTDSHPALVGRMRTLHTKLRQIAWRPPGRISSREFERFRAELNSAHPH